jgi:hypothetical protein
MRNLVLNATILTALKCRPSNGLISQHADVGVNLRIEGIGIERPFEVGIS